MESLVERRDAPFGSLFYLRFIQPLDLQESARALAGERRLAKEQQSEFHAGVGRLARGGLLPRLGDGLFSLSLLLRGNVPGATAAAAALKYARAPSSRTSGTSTTAASSRQSGWTICQYWFFFAYNPWRSGFHGVNDHESDWEMISVYLYEDEGRARPGVGRVRLARLPRRRPAPPLGRPPPTSSSRTATRSSTPAPGSHAVVLHGRASTRRRCRSRRRGASSRLAEALSGFWRTTLGQGDDTGSPLRIPFIDFARGDGLSIGPGQPNEWTPNVIDETTPWVSKYRGLWGLFAQRSDLRRERAGRADVRPRRLAAPVLVRPARLRRARPGPAAARGGRGAGGGARAARAARRELDRADPRGDQAISRELGVRLAEHAREPAPRGRGGEARGRRRSSRPRSSPGCARSAPRTTPSSRGCGGGSSALRGARARRPAGSHPARGRAGRRREDALRPRCRDLGRGLDQRSCWSGSRC